MAIYVSGSLAFDRIMTFGGNLQDHVLMDKLHMLSVSFMVDSMDERRGGCAGNIAYTLALLGEKPIVVSAAGRDFTGYAAAWEKLGLSAGSGDGGGMSGAVPRLPGGAADCDHDGGGGHR